MTLPSRRVALKVQLLDTRRMKELAVEILNFEWKRKTTGGAAAESSSE